MTSHADDTLRPVFLTRSQLLRIDLLFLKGTKNYSDKTHIFTFLYRSYSLYFFRGHNLFQVQWRDFMVKHKKT